MIGHRLIQFDPNEHGKSKFEQLLDLFMQMLTYTNGDVGEAMQWMNQLDKQYQLTDDEYGMGDFIDELKEKGYINENNENGEIKITAKSEQTHPQEKPGGDFWKTEENKAGRPSPPVSRAGR